MSRCHIRRAARIGHRYPWVEKKPSFAVPGLICLHSQWSLPSDLAPVRQEELACLRGRAHLRQIFVLVNILVIEYKTETYVLLVQHGTTTYYHNLLNISRHTGKVQQQAEPQIGRSLMLQQQALHWLQSADATVKMFAKLLRPGLSMKLNSRPLSYCC